MYVFVYGTLKRGKPLHKWMEKDEVNFVSDGICDELNLFLPNDHFAYPFVVKEEGLVKGEVYKIEDEFLKTLDHVEGYPSLYDRIKVNVMTDNGNHECIVYCLSDRKLKQLRGKTFEKTLEY